MQNNLNSDNKEGLKRFLTGLGLFRSIGSTINSKTLALDMAMPEMEAYANDEMNQGRGIRRYDGTWAKPEEVLDLDIFGDDMLRITYDEEGKTKLNDLNLTKDLGWLGTNTTLKDYIDKTKNPRAKSQYEKLIEGKSLDVLNSIKKSREDEAKGILNKSDKGTDVKGRFTLMTDENGNPYWQEVLTDANNRKTMEAAGIALVNAYGPNKYSDGVLKSGMRSFAKGLADVVPNIMGLFAGAEDVVEAAANGITGNGFVAERTQLNEAYDAANKYLEESMVGKTSYISQQGLFENWESFSSLLGQGASSLVTYGAVGRGIGLAQKGLTKVASSVLPKVLTSTKHFAAAEKVASMLSEKGIKDESLGTIGKFINKALVKDPYLIPMYGSGIVLNYGEAYKAAIDAGLPLQDAALVGLTSGVINTLVETKYGPNTMAKYLLGKKGATETAKMIIKEVGGDISKLSDKAISDGVISKVFNNLELIMKIPVLGTMAEEGSEEVIQGFVKNSVESFYDSFLAPSNVKVNDGRFGTEIFSKESLKGMLEDGTVGALLGALGGFANSRTKENDNIIPYIVNDNLSEFEAGAALALLKLAITQEQYDGIMNRANSLQKLFDTNKNLFIKIASVSDKTKLLAIMSDVLGKIRDQEDYAKSAINTNDSFSDTFNNIVKTQSDNFGAIDLLNNFVTVLNDNGRKAEADMLSQTLKDSELITKDLLKNSDEVEDKNVLAIANQTIQNQIFNHLFDSSIRNNLSNKLNTEQLSLLAKIESNPKLKDTIKRINNILSGNRKIATSTEKTLSLINEYNSDKITEDRKNEIRKELKKLLKYQHEVLIKELGAINNTDVKKYIDNHSVLAVTRVLDLLEDKDLEDIKKQAPNLAKETLEYIDEINEKKKLELNNQAEKEQQKKDLKEAEEKAPVNLELEDSFNAYKESIKSTEPDLYSKLSSEDGMTVVNALESDRKTIVDRLNSATAELKKEPTYQVLQQQLKDLNKIIPYLRNKHNITKSEYDLNKKHNLNLKSDNSTYTSKLNPDKKYKILRDKLLYSENKGLIVPISDVENEDDVKEYTEKDDFEFINSLVDLNGIPLSRKLRADRLTFFMTQNKVNASFADQYEPNSEDETESKHEDKKLSNYFINMLKGIPISDTFKRILSDPRYKASEYYGSIESYTWNGMDENSKKAKSLFDSVVGKKKYSDLTKEEKDLLIDYLPIQFKLLHSGLKNKEGKLFENIVAIPSRKSKTSLRFPMNDDLVNQRESVIKQLVDNGKYDIEKGDIEIQPGYYNQTKSEKTITDDQGVTHVISSDHNNIASIKSLNIKREGGDYYFVDPSTGNKERVVIGIADDNGLIRYTELLKDGQVFERTVDGQGSPGTPYLILPTFSSLNKKQRYAVKLNPTKIDKQTATVIAKLMYSLAKGYKSKEVLLNTTINSLPDVFGIKADRSTTIEEVLDELVFWGKKTIQNGEVNRPYLERKLLYIDFAKGQVRYGDKQTILGEGEEELQLFINWITENKSFAINRSKINSFDKTDTTFSIGDSYSIKMGEDYLMHIIDSNVVTTDLNQDGPLYSNPTVRLKLVKELKPTIIPEVKTEPKKELAKPQETKKATNTSDRIISTIEKGGTRKGTKKLKLALLNSDGPVTLKISMLDGTSDVYNDTHNKKVGSLDDIEFIYEDGKLNGKPVVIAENKTLGVKGGLIQIIADIISDKFKGADVLKSDIGNIELVQDTIEEDDLSAEEETKKADLASDKSVVITYTSEIDLLLPNLLSKLEEKFEGKVPSRSDVDTWLSLIVNQTNGVAKIYGFKDYKLAREVLQSIGSNGLTFQQNLIEYLINKKVDESKSTLQEITKDNITKELLLEATMEYYNRKDGKNMFSISGDYSIDDIYQTFIHDDDTYNKILVIANELNSGKVKPSDDTTLKGKEFPLSNGEITIDNITFEQFDYAYLLVNKEFYDEGESKDLFNMIKDTEHPISKILYKTRIKDVIEKANELNNAKPSNTISEEASLAAAIAAEDNSGPSLEDIVSSLFHFPTFGGGANKLVSELDKKRNYKRITSEEKDDLRRILGKKYRNIKWVNDFVSILDYVGNPAKAHGVMTRTAMILYKNAKSGTGYHEAFHNVSLFLLTPSQRELMYNEARSKYKMKKASNKEIEEKLADEFMLFAEDARINKHVKSNTGILGFFNKVWDWVKRQFGFRPPYKDINALFNKIYKGDYAKVRTDKSSLLYFDNAYGKDAKIPLIINGITINMDTKTLYSITNSLTALLLFDNNITSIDSVRKGIDFFKYKTKILTILKDSEDLLSNSKNINEIEKASTLINIYSEIYNNWDTVFKPLIENKLDGYGIRLKREDTSLTINEDLSNLINDEVKASWEISAKHNAKAEVRMLFLALPETNEVDPVTMLPRYANPDLIWFKVLESLHTARTFDEMMSRLTALSEEAQKMGNTGINPYSFLLSLLNSGSQTLKTQFFNTFKKHRNKFINFSYVENGDGLDINVGDADINKRSNDINRLWSKVFALSLPLLYPDKFKKVKESFQTLLNSINDNSNVDSKISEFVALLTNFNVVVDNKTIYSFMNEPAYVDTKDARSFKNFLNSSAVSSIFGSKKSGKSLTDKLINKGIKPEDMPNVLAKDSFFKALAKRYVKNNPVSEDDSIPGPEGNLVYSYSDNNTITSMFEEWLKDIDFVNQLSQDTYTKDSYWMELITKDVKVRNSLSVSTMLALMDKENYSDSRGYLDISDKEDLIIKLKAVMEGKMPLPTLANKKSYYFINGINKFVVKTSFEKGKGLVINDAVIDRFIKYANTEILTIKESEKTINDFLSELDLTREEFNNLKAKDQRALLQKKSKESPKFLLLYKDLSANYHYSMAKDNYKKDGVTVYDSKIKLGANGSKFRYFNELQELLNSGKTIEQIEEYSNSPEFRNTIEKLLYKRINETIKTFIKVGILNTNSEGVIDSKTLKILDNNNSIAYDVISKKDYNYIPVLKNKEGVGEYLSDPTVLALIITDYAINTAITNIEFEKVISGDLAFYKAKSLSDALDDRVKRFSALTSTKQIMRSDIESDGSYPIDFNTDKYRTITLGTNTIFSKLMHDLMYNKYVGTIENPGLLYSRFISFAEEGRKGYYGKTNEELYEMAQKDALNRLDNYKEVDPTDALVWISPRMFRKLAIMNGEWSEKKELAYNLLESDKVLTKEEELQANELVMQPLKYIHYGFRFNSRGLKVPIYDKMSLSTVFRRNVTGTDMMNMYKYMIDNDVDMVKMETAVKSGNSPFYTFYDENGKVNDLNNSLVFELEFKYIGKQLVTDPHNVETTTLLTQFTKIVASNVADSDIYELEDKPITGKELKQQYVDAIVNLSERGVKRIIRQFGYNKGNIDKKQFMALLLKTLLDGNSTQNLREALKYAEQEDDYFIEPSVLPCINQIQSKLISKIKKETIDIHTPGNAFYQTTSFGYDITGQYRKVTNKNTVRKFDDKLKFLNDNNRLEVKISIDLFNGMIPAKYKTFEELRLYILTNPELFAFSYRVPTQGKNSTLAIQVVDVLPHSAGNVILLPYEVTTLTGSDFDIDKMYLASYNYYEKDSKMTKIPFIDRNDYDSEEEFIDAIYYDRYGYKKSLEFKNRMNEIKTELDYIAKINNGKALTNDSKQLILDLASNNSDVINRNRILEIMFEPLDSFNTLSEIINYIESTAKVPNEAKFIEDNRGKSMWELNSEEAVENRLLDVFTSMQVNDNSYIDATTPLDVTTKPLKDMVEKNKKTYDSLEPLFPTYQEDIKSKNTGADSGIGPMALINSFRSLLLLAKIKLNNSGILSELLIDSLDNTFDDEGISILDWTSALINAHVDAAKDPYIMNLNVNKFDYSMTAFLTSIGFGRTTFSFLPQPVLVDLALNYMKYNDSNIGVTDYDKYSNKYLKETEKEYYDNTTQDEIDSINRAELISNIRNSEWLDAQRNTPEDQRDSMWYAYQYSILLIYGELKPYADALSDLIAASLIDTAKFGINASELLTFRHLMEKVKLNNLITNTNDIFNKTFLGPKYENSVQLLFDMLLDQILDFSPTFVLLIEKILSITGNYFKKDPKTANYISNEIKSAIFTNFFKNVEGADILSLFYGNNSVVSRVARLLLEIANGDHIELKGNQLLNMLLPNVYNTEDKPMMFENSIVKQRDTESKNEITFAWRDLLESEDELVRQLGEDLIKYSFYLGGGTSSGIYNFYDLAPYDYLANILNKEGVTFLNYIKNMVQDFNNLPMNQLDSNLLYNIFESTFRGSLTNDKLIPVIKFKDDKTAILRDEKGNIKYIKMLGDYNRFLTNKDGSVKPFTKTKDNKGNITLYKLVGYVRHEGSEIEDAELVYARTYNTGYSNKGFRVKEGSAYTIINDLSLDYSYGDINLGKKILNDGIFEKISDNDVYDFNSFENNNIEYNNEGEAIEINNNPEEAKENAITNSKTPEFDKLPSYTGNTMTYAGIGSRLTPKEIKDEMEELAKELESKGYTLNTGTVNWDDDGADQAFARGTTKKNQFGPDDANETTIKIAKEIHPNPKALKGTGLNLMARNTYQIFGANLDTPVDFVIAWTKDGKTGYDGRPTGGTGQAVEMAAKKGIPVINMYNSNWKDELDKVLSKKKDTVKEEDVKGENIISSGSTFAKKLTNVQFGNLNAQIDFRGKRYVSAEHAYQTWKSGKFDNDAFERGKKGGKQPGKKGTDKSSNFDLMVEILVNKLMQHEDLLNGIDDRGGEAYIRKSTHDGYNDTYWETKSGQNKFIEALLNAYKTVKFVKDNALLQESTKENELEQQNEKC